MKGGFVQRECQCCGYVTEGIEGSDALLAEMYEHLAALHPLALPAELQPSVEAVHRALLYRGKS